MRYEIQTTEGIVYLTDVADVYDYAETLAENTEGVQWFDIDGTEILGCSNSGDVVLATVTIVDYYA